ncbi:MAG TPA: PAS domain-containing protein, partial [Pseudomonas sp.]|nr:PAS domain-containing protein [Pseudomonas sp.]
MRPSLSRPLRLAGIYILFSVVWILLSDRLLLALDLSSDTLSWLQTSKGLLFVLVSSLLILFIGQHDQRAQRQLENSLRLRAQQLRQTQREAGLGSWEYSDRFHWSGEALRLLGRTEGSHSGSLDEFLGWLHPADRKAVQRALQALLEDAAPLLINARLNRPAHEEPLWLMLRGEPANAAQAQGTLQNISNQKRDEQALRESEQRFRQLFEQTPRIAVQGYDRERRVIFWNQASTLLYGYSVAEAMGRRLEDLIIPPARRAQAVDAINSWMIGGPAVPAAELTLRNRDGSDVHVYSSHLLLRNARHQLEMYSVDIALDEQKQAHLELEASEARYRELVEQLHEAIFLTDSRGRLTFLNPAWQSLTGFSINQSLGRPLLDFIAEDQQPRLGEQIAKILAQQSSSWQGESRLCEEGGQCRWISLRLTGGAQQDQGLRGSFSDIHQRHQTQALQEARNVVLDSMLAQQPLQRTCEDMTRCLERINPEMLV